MALAIPVSFAWDRPGTMEAVNNTDQAKRARVLVNIFLPACVLVLAAFYLLIFRRDNAAPVVDLAGFSNGSHAGFQYRMEKCWSNGKKLAAAGWVVREGHGNARRTVRVVLVDDQSGQARALKTTQFDRQDVSKQINQQLGDAVRYRNAGFAASLNLAAAEPPVRPGALYVAYDDAGRKVLLPIPCRVGQRR